MSKSDLFTKSTHNKLRYLSLVNVPSAIVEILFPRKYLQPKKKKINRKAGIRQRTFKH